MAESVDALVSNTSGATRAGSTPALGTFANRRKSLKTCKKFFSDFSLNGFSPHLQGFGHGEAYFLTRKTRIQG